MHRAGAGHMLTTVYRFINNNSMNDRKWPCCEAKTACIKNTCCIYRWHKWGQMTQRYTCIFSVIWTGSDCNIISHARQVSSGIHVNVGDTFVTSLSKHEVCTHVQEFDCQGHCKMYYLYLKCVSKIFSVMIDVKDDTSLSYKLIKKNYEMWITTAWIVVWRS